MPQRRPATASLLIRKPLRTASFVLNTADDDGEPIEVEVKLRAISSTDYDDLVAEHPPTAKQSKAGDTINTDTFAPALFARMFVEPEMSVEEATQMWTSPTWSSGEKADLYVTCTRLCTAGLDVPFTSAG